MENQHIDFDGAIYGVDGAFDPSFDPNRQTYNFSQTWPLPISPGTVKGITHNQVAEVPAQHHRWASSSTEPLGLYAL